MKQNVLALVPGEVIPSFDTMLKSLGEAMPVTIVKLADEEMDDLAAVITRHDLEQYQRCLVLLKFRRIKNQAKVLRNLPGLVIWETDALQDRLAESRLYGEFSKFYSKIPVFRLLCTGFSLSQYFQNQGIDAHFLGRGADTTVFYDTNQDRDIECGFLGRLSGAVYSERNRIITSLQSAVGLQVLRAEGVENYRSALNRIRIFISPDTQFREHLYKNFEAMACGCLLIAHRNGDGEEEAVGLIDQENALLYGTETELLEKIYWARKNQDRTEKIRLAGNRLVRERWSFAELGKKMAALIEAPLVSNGSFKHPWWRSS